MSEVPPAEHALPSDCGAAALVTATGSVDWMCLPGFDDPPAFARLLDGGPGTSRSGPLTRPHSRAGATDLPARCSKRAGRVARGLSRSQTHRPSADTNEAMTSVAAHRASSCEGSAAPTVQMEVDVEFAPRPEFGLVHPRLTRYGRMMVADGGATVLVLSTELELTVDGDTATGSIPAVGRRGVRLVGQHPIGSRARTAGTTVADAEGVEHRGEGTGVGGLPARQDQSQRPALAVGREVDLAGHTASGAADRRVVRRLEIAEPPDMDSCNSIQPPVSRLRVAPCWWTRVIVESTDTVHSTSPFVAATPWTVVSCRAQVPSVDQSETADRSSSSRGVLDWCRSDRSRRRYVLPRHRGRAARRAEQSGLVDRWSIRHIRQAVRS